MILEKIKKNISPLGVIFILEIFVVAFALFGFIPREAILIWTGIAVFFIIFSDPKDSLWLIIASIPLYAALPISDSFDTLANWRILILTLFSVLLFNNKVSYAIVKDAAGRWRIAEKLKHYAVEYLCWLFLFIAALSIIAADYKILSVKKLIFLANIFLLFLIVRNIIQKKEDVIRVWRAFALGAAIAIAVAIVQFFSVMFIPLASFWNFWSDKIISVLYGQDLAGLLSYSNTWFAYFNSAPPTLRLFSVFPDSHSLAMFLIISAPVFLTLSFINRNNKLKRIIYSWLTGLSFFGIVFSGSRGAWLSIAALILVSFYFSWKKISPEFIKKAMAGILIFLLLFIFSNAYPLIFYKIQALQTGEDINASFSFFERAKSISDTEELSNKGRLEIWRLSVKSIVQHPWLGVGLGNYVNVLDEEPTFAKKGASAHNLYLDIASEIGIIGAILLIMIIFNILYNCWAVFRRSNESYFRAYALFFGLYLLWILTYSLFDVVLLNDKVLLSFMVATALLFCIRRIEFENNGCGTKL